MNSAMDSQSGFDKLEREGWVKQFIVNEPRLSEAVAIYKEAGFDVHLESLPKGHECETCAAPEEKGECRVCFEGFEDQYKIIFTRRRKDVKPPDEDRF
jgi:hypothetical protein